MSRMSSVPLCDVAPVDVPSHLKKRVPQLIVRTAFLLFHFKCGNEKKRHIERHRMSVSVQAHVMAALVC